jgi:hypothetical protein
MLGERTEPGGQNHPRAVGPGRLDFPINGTPGARLLQASSSLLPLFVCSSFQSRTALDLAILPKLVFSNNSHP